MTEQSREESPLIKFFNFSHLPEHLQKISSQFHTLAVWIDYNLPNGAEKTVALRKLLESKDCAVRTSLENPQPVKQAA